MLVNPSATRSCVWDWEGHEHRHSAGEGFGVTLPGPGLLSCKLFGAETRGVTLSSAKAGGWRTIKVTIHNSLLSPAYPTGLFGVSMESVRPETFIPPQGIRLRSDSRGVRNLSPGEGRS